MTWNLNEVARNRSQQKFNESSLSLCQYHMRELRASCFLQVLDINGIIMVPQSHNMGDCELSLDPIDCKSTVCPQKRFSTRLWTHCSVTTKFKACSNGTQVYVEDS